MKRLGGWLFPVLLVTLSSCIVVTAGKVDNCISTEEKKRIETFQSIANPKLPPEVRARALVDRMTLQQKMRFISGYKMFFTIPIPELGIRSMKFADASMGIRANGRSTAFPGAVCYAAAFNRRLAFEVGQVIGEE